MRFTKFSSAVLCSLILFSCQKNKDEFFLAKNEMELRQNASKQGLRYENEVLFLKSDEKKNIVAPKSVPKVGGIFEAIPEGLALDEISGEINVKASLSGMKYKVFYKNRAGQRVDSTQVTIGGLDYEDITFQYGVDRDLSIPVLNANKNLKLPKNTNGTSDDIIVDIQDIGNSGLSNQSGSALQTLMVDKKTGAINVEESLRRGFFGTPAPSTGSKRDVSVSYRINDESEKELNRIDITFYYFKKWEDVPSSLLKILEDRKSLKQRVDKMPLPGNTTTTTDSGDVDPLDCDSFAKKARPPFIIIVDS